jgi:amino acid adenylation domain-containing protein
VPERIAVATDVERVSYGELERRSNGIAMYLRRRGVERGDRVGIYAHRSIEAIAAMLGILKAGAIYVPFDPAYPAKLLRFIHDDCAPSLMLVQRALAGDFWNEAAAQFIDAAVLDAAPFDARLLPATKRDDPAYIMYTSGSTGHPKGVLVPHRGVVRLVIDNPFVHMGPDEVHLQLAPLAFDASTFEIWGALLHGATLAILTTPVPSLDDIAAGIARHGVTTLWLTAGLFHVMVDQRLRALEPLRQLIAGGDVLSAAHVARAQQGLPSCQLVNGYGPTENTTFTCCYRIPRPAPAGPIPIGTPIAHTAVHVLDEAGRAVADGDEGELHAGGDGVALGYWNRPALTERCFVDGLYRTGDRVRRRADGNLEFLGRVDRQVKLNGKRVELDEIEACLRRSGLVVDAAVTCTGGAETGRKIHAYVTPPPGRAAAIGDLREFLRSEIPDYMWPSSISVLDALPLSPTGKVDRSALPRPTPLGAPAAAAQASGAGTAGSARQANIEAALLELWREVLGTEAVGVHDNFFDLGGTSLHLIQVHARICDSIDAAVTVIDLFQQPRIRSLAHWMAERPDSPAAAAAAAAAAAPPAAASPAAGILNPSERARRQSAALARARPAMRGQS